MKRFIYCIGLILLISTYAVAETLVNFNSQLFAYLDRTKMSTNILADKGGAASLLFGMDGSFQTEPYSLAYWQYAYQSLYVGDTSISVNPIPTDLIDQVTNTFDSEIIINAVCYKYNSLKEDALESGLIHIQDSMVFDGPVLGNPYEEKLCFSVGVMFEGTLNQQATFVGGQVFGNMGNELSSIYIDFDDGQGYVEYYSTKRFEINFPVSGKHIVTLKIVLADNTTLYARTSIETENLEISPCCRTFEL